MNKSAVAIELDKIFKLLKACFDKDALFKLIAKSLNLDKYIRGVLDKHKIEYKSDFHPEKAMRDLVKTKTHRKDEDDIVQSIVIYLFHPESNKKDIIKTFFDYKEKHPEANFETHFNMNITTALNNFLRHEKTHSPGQRGHPDDSGVFLKEKPTDVEKLHDFQDLVDKTNFKDYVDELKEWMKDHGTKLEEKIVNIRLEDPKLSLEEIGNMLGISAEEVKKALKEDIRKLFIDYALSLKEEGEGSLYNSLKKMKFVPDETVKKHGNIASVLEYMERLETLI